MTKLQKLRKKAKTRSPRLHVALWASAILMSGPDPFAPFFSDESDTDETAATAQRPVAPPPSVRPTARRPGPPPSASSGSSAKPSSARRSPVDFVTAEVDRMMRAVEDSLPPRVEFKERSRRLANLAERRKRLEEEAKSENKENGRDRDARSDDGGDKSDSTVVRLSAERWHSQMTHDDRERLAKIKAHIASVYGAIRCQSGADCHQNVVLEAHFPHRWMAKRFMRAAPHDQILPGFLSFFSKWWIRGDPIPTSGGGSGGGDGSDGEDCKVAFKDFEGDQDEEDGDGEPSTNGDGFYFKSYACPSIHRTMLQDTTRTLAYERAIRAESEFLRGRVVMDVGCGTGILSIFAARSGAGHVYAVDNSDVVQTAREIVRDNGLEDKITVIRGRAETLSLPRPADVLLSEWMGYELFYEAMLADVLRARDRQLKERKENAENNPVTDPLPPLLMMPDECLLEATGVRDPEGRRRRLGWLESCWESDMTAAEGVIRQSAVVEDVDPAMVSTNPDAFLRLDLNTLSVLEATRGPARVPREFRLRLRQGFDRVDAICLSFRCRFRRSSVSRRPIGGISGRLPPPLEEINTSPLRPRTHWRQTVLLLKKPLIVRDPVSAEIVGFIQMLPVKRGLDIRLQISTTEDEEAAEPEVQRFLHL